MSDTKSSAPTPASSISTPLEFLLGNIARDFVFKQATFVVNRPYDHHVNTATTKGMSALDARKVPGAAKTAQDAWRAEAETAAAEPDTLHTPSGVGAPPKGYMGAMELALSKPPTAVNCGEMAMLAYQRIVKTAMSSGFTVGVAAVTIAEGNHSFVILGTDPGFLRTLKSARRNLFGVSTLRPPPFWGMSVAVCDPWIDAGKCLTFNANQQEPHSDQTRWRAYLQRIVGQAKCNVTDSAIKNNTILEIVFDASVVIEFD